MLIVGVLSFLFMISIGILLLASNKLLFKY